MPPRHSHKSRAYPKVQRFPKFLELPTEIRLKVFEFALCFDGVEPQIDYVDFHTDHMKHFQARERGNYIEPEPKPRPWPILVHLNALSWFRPFLTTFEDCKPPSGALIESVSIR